MSSESTDSQLGPAIQETRQYEAEVELGVPKATILPSANQPAEPPTTFFGEESASIKFDLPVAKAVVLPSAQKPAEPPKDATNDR